jgi:hypothetical protein
MSSIVFVDRPLWQARAFHLVVGRKGVGKGTVLADLAARFTRNEFGEERSVVWISSEDSPSIDIHPRVVAAGGDPDRVAIVKTWVQLPKDLSRLGTLVDEIGDVGLLIVDPVGNHITGKNSNAETDIRDAIAPLNEFADAHDLLAVGVRHLTQKEAKAGALAAVLGGSAWVQVPRAVIAIARDRTNGRVSHIQCLIGNRLPPETPGRRFEIEGVLLPDLTEPVTRTVWLGSSKEDVETLLGEAQPREPSSSADTRELILDLLDDAPGQQMESDALDARVARETGLAAKTVRNLRAELKDAGLLRAVPEKDDRGLVVRWHVARTQAPRLTDSGAGSDPEPDPSGEPRANGLPTREPAPEPLHTNTGSGLIEAVEGQAPEPDRTGTRARPA